MHESDFGQVTTVTLQEADEVEAVRDVVWAIEVTTVEKGDVRGYREDAVTGELLWTGHVPIDPDEVVGGENQ